MRRKLRQKTHYRQPLWEEKKKRKNSRKKTLWSITQLFDFSPKNSMESLGHFALKSRQSRESHKSLYVRIFKLTLFICDNILLREPQVNNVSSSKSCYCFIYIRYGFLNDFHAAYSGPFQGSV